jgi:hypothetical protein
MKRSALLLAVAATLTAHPAAALVRCVNPTGAGGCSKTIQGAVTAAAGLDTVSVAAGVYFESVTIPAGKDGLTIVGASKTGTILDPSPNSAFPFAAGGNGFLVQSNNVKIRNLTIRNGLTDQIRIAGNNTLVQLVRLIASGQSGVLVDASYTGTQILSSEFRSPFNYGILAPGAANTAIKGNLMQTCDNGCINVMGDNVVVSANRLFQSEDHGAIQVYGNGAAITSNVILGSDLHGIYVEGNNAGVQYNKVSDALSGGIVIKGYGSTVKFNTIANAGTEGIWVGTPTGNGGTVSSNVVTNAGGFGVYFVGGNPVASANRVTHTGDDGLYVNAYESTGPVVSPVTASVNVVAGAAGTGVYAKGSEVTADRNQVRDSLDKGLELTCFTCAASSVSYNIVANTGQDADGVNLNLAGSGMGTDLLYNTVSRSMGYAYYLSGSGAVTATGNKALDQGGDAPECCFYIAVDNSTFSSNVAARCAENGFYVFGSNNLLQANLTQSNYGNGFDIVGDNNTLKGNRSQLNAGAGFAVTFGTGNSLTNLNVGGLNRTDFCDDGTGTTQLGNTFTSTAPDCDINR